MPGRTDEEPPHVNVGDVVFYMDRPRYVRAAAQKQTLDPLAAIVARIYYDKEGKRIGTLNLFVLDPELGAKAIPDVPFAPTLAPESWTPKPAPAVNIEVPLDMLRQLVAVAVAAEFAEQLQVILDQHRETVKAAVVEELGEATKELEATIVARLTPKDSE